MASGLTSDFYVDARQTSLYAKGAQLIARLSVKAAPEVTAIESV